VESAIDNVAHGRLATVRHPCGLGVGLGNSLWRHLFREASARAKDRHRLHVRRTIHCQPNYAMKRLRHWKLLLALALVFGAGAVTGTVWTHLKFKRAFEWGFESENWVNAAMDHLQGKLELTTDQQPKVRAILEDTGQQIKAKLGQTVEESGEIIVQSWRRTSQELTPEQREIFQRMCQAFRDRLKQKLNIELPEE